MFEAGGELGEEPGEGSAVMPGEAFGFGGCGELAADQATPSCSRPCSMIFSDIGNILGLPLRAQWSSPPKA